MATDELDKVLLKSKLSFYVSIIVGTAILVLAMRVWLHLENLPTDNQEVIELILKIESFELSENEQVHIGVANDILLEFLEKRMFVLSSMFWVVVMFALIFFYHAFEQIKLRKTITKIRGG